MQHLRRQDATRDEDATLQVTADFGGLGVVVGHATDQEVRRCSVAQAARENCTRWHRSTSPTALTRFS
jgi:hypothetical protein